MNIQPSLCIDLGSAFTKIAVRTELNQTSQLLMDRGQETVYQICIPSLAANKIGTNRWAFGWEVLDYKETETIKLHQNWKARLFDIDKVDLTYDIPIDGKMDEAEKFLIANDPFHQALACCREFLKSIRADLIPLLLDQHLQYKGIRVEDFDTHICVPEFVLDTSIGKVMETIMAEAGFKTQNQFCISEPKASLIGVLTEGQNHVDKGGLPNISYMFRELELLRKLTVGGHGIFFLDVGAFTTDVALCNFHQNSTGHLDQSPSASFPLGLFKLDDMVQSALGKDFANTLRNSSPKFREHFHLKAYSGDAVSGNIMLQDGTTLPVAQIDKCIDEFAAAIDKSVKAFLKVHKKQKIYAAVLTGGGSLCTRLTSRIAKAMDEYNIPILSAHREEGIQNLATISEQLIRGSSAIGGTSILYSF